VTAAAKKRPVRSRAKGAKKKTAAAPRSVITTIEFGDDVLSALDSLAAAGVFPIRLPRTRAARVRWLVVNFARCHARLVSAHALADKNAKRVDEFVLALAPFATVLGRFDSDDGLAALRGEFPDAADLDFS